MLGEHPGAHLFVAGSGGAAFETRLRRLTRDLGLAAQVTFTGFLSGELKWSALAAADVFVLPSLQENFGIAVAEAMHASLPVIVSQEVDISAEVEEAGAGVVLGNRGDPKGLASAICRMLGSGSYRRRAGDSARVHASSRFTWAAVARHHAALYDVVATSDPIEPSPAERDDLTFSKLDRASADRPSRRPRQALNDGPATA